MRSLLARVALACVGAVGLGVVAAPGASAATSGVNDWSCHPSAAHPNPVVLVHGLGANDALNFATLGPRISGAGYCVFSQTYGTTFYGPLVGGLAPMEDSAAQLGAFVDRVRAATGAAKVDIVGHSEGTTVPAYYLKFLGGAAKVEHFAGFGSNFTGTTLQGLGTLGQLLGIGNLLTAGGCAACAEFLPGSDFLARLNAGGVVVPGPTYTSIVSRYDEVVTPYTSGVINAPNAHTVVLQDRCGLDFTGHLGQAIDPNVASYVLNALDPAHAKPVACVPFFDFGA